MALFLVTGSYIDPGPLLPPQQVVPMMEQMVFPSMEAVAKLQDQKKILAGGLVTGERALAFMLEAASNIEVSRLLVELPFWGIVKWDVKPLDPIRERVVEERKGIDHLKQMLK
jgi:hypothetical protein